MLDLRKDGENVYVPQTFVRRIMMGEAIKSEDGSKIRNVGGLRLDCSGQRKCWGNESSLFHFRVPDISSSKVKISVKRIIALA